MQNDLYAFFESISPSQLAKIRGTRQETSTRDRERFLKKVKEVQDILTASKHIIEIKKK